MIGAWFWISYAVLGFCVMVVANDLHTKLDVEMIWIKRRVILLLGIIWPVVLVLGAIARIRKEER